MLIKGVIFDMDGLILDTEKLYQRFWKEASYICGFAMPQEITLKLRSLDKKLAKKCLKDFFGEEYSYEKVKDIRVKLMSDYVEKNGVEAKKGVRELIEYLKKNKYKTAVATSTNYERANLHLKLAGVRDCFENIICACDMERGKPFPDVYIYACGKLGLEPFECVALEDSPNGLRSAYSAGCIPIAVPDGNTTDSDIDDIVFAKANSLLEVRDILSQIKING